MLKRQKVSKFLLIIPFIFMLGVIYPAIGESINDTHTLADSLFNERKYTQSFMLYEELLNKDKIASPVMLLKMAFIQEGLGDYTRSLYYLNLYYLKTFDRRVLKKMENLAETYHLQGYNYDDTEFFLNIYHRYRVQINLGIMVIALLIAAILVYRKRTYHSRPIVSGFAFIIALVMLFWLNNFGREKPQAIISDDAVYLMDGPSAGADVIAIIGKGHRVELLGTRDVWTKIAWDEQDVFVKNQHLLPLKF